MLTCPGPASHVKSEYTIPSGAGFCPSSGQRSEQLHDVPNGAPPSNRWVSLLTRGLGKHCLNVHWRKALGTHFKAGVESSNSARYPKKGRVGNSFRRECAAKSHLRHETSRIEVALKQSRARSRGWGETKNNTIVNRKPQKRLLK